MRSFYPEIEPYDHGMLDVGDGHRVYWELCGNPNGKPVVFLHGGPGGGCSPSQRRLFDPDKYRILLFDQRGCGRSTPYASLEANTTWHLVADIERLREMIGVDKWMVFGGSWGATLALAYAETHPERVTELVLRGIFTLRRAELLWYYQEGASWIFPGQVGGLSRTDPGGRARRPDGSLSRRLIHPDPAVQREGGARPGACGKARRSRSSQNQDYSDQFGDAHYAIAFARIENHYFVNEGWFEEGQLIRNAHRLKNIPGVIIQGRYDIVRRRPAWHEPGRCGHAVRADHGHSGAEAAYASSWLPGCEATALYPEPGHPDITVIEGTHAGCAIRRPDR